MRIHRISLRNFRGVRSADVSLALSGVTIIQGPNEVGKTSLADAIVFLFDEPETSSKSKLKAVKPVDRDVGPSVEIELTTGAYHLIYSKQWFVGKKTELRILAPTPANHTGREAHDRVLGILEETLDRALFGALRYQQGVSITQAALGDSRTLAAALDAAVTGAALGGDEEANLFERVERERERYFTATGRPTTARAADAQKLVELQQRVRDVEAELRALDTSAERHREIGIETAAIAQEQTTQLDVITERKTYVDQLATKEHAVELLKLARESSEGRVRESRAASEARQKLIGAVGDAESLVAALQEDATRETHGLETARTAQSEAVAARDLARSARETAETESQRASSDFEHFRDILEHQLLSERRTRAEDAEATIRTATAFLDACRIDQDKLDEIEQASLGVAEARGRASVEQVTLAVDAIQPLRIEIGDEAATLGAGERFERTVAGDIDLTLGDVARVTVAGQQTGRAVQEAAQTAGRHLASLFDDVGIAGDDALSQARALVRQRSDAERSVADATTTLTDNLRDLTLQLVAEKVERYETKIASYRAKRDTSIPLPADLDEAKRLSEAASEFAAQARRGEEQCQEVLEQAEAFANGLQEEAGKRSVRVELAEAELKDAQEQLDIARLDVSDAEIEQRRAEDEQAGLSAAAAHDKEAVELAAADPASARTLLENAEAVLDRLHNDQRALELELASIKAELDVRGQAGLADQLAAAQSELARVERMTTLTERRAVAVELLHARLSAHRDAARRSYVAPFQQQLEGFARIVFGPTVAIEVDHETLEIVSRTMDGVTVPYDSLSSGAKEQLCVLARLACAALVSPASENGGDGGVPVIFDDALGYSDVGRLERVGAAFNSAGQQSQVIVLTCVPERYRNIGSATVIHLEEGPLHPAAA